MQRLKAHNVSKQSSSNGSHALLEPVISAVDGFPLGRDSMKQRRLADDFNDCRTGSLMGKRHGRSRNPCPGPSRFHGMWPL